MKNGNKCDTIVKNCFLKGDIVDETGYDCYFRSWKY